MYIINTDDSSIYVTRGDIVMLTVTAMNGDAAYVFQPGEVLRFKIFGKKDCENVVMQKDFPVTAAAEFVEITLGEEDTKFGPVISKPTDYWYEIELNPFTNPQTIVGYSDDGPTVFRLYPEGDDIESTDYEPTPEDIPVVDDELDLTSVRPVQNQAIARAVAQLDEAFTSNKEDMSWAVKSLKNEIKVERARIDNMATLQDGSTTGDAELADIRVGANGEIYGTAGGAVRGQVEKIYKELQQQALFDDIIRKQISEIEAVPLMWVANCYWNTATDVADLTSYTGYYYASNEVHVEPGERYFITGEQGSSLKQRLWAVTDANYNVLAKTEISGLTEFTNAEINIPEGGAKLLITRHSGTAADTILMKERYKTIALVEDLPRKDLEGLYVSVIGDSISALNGYIPEGNDPYYGTGIGGYQNMWWWQFCQKLKATPLVIEAWSGSTVTQGVVEGKTEASNPSRCRKLHAYVKCSAEDCDYNVALENINLLNMSPFSGEIALGDHVKLAKPDIVIIAMGVNDYSYGAPLGDWDGSVKPNQAERRNFRSAYAAMLVQIHAEYPNAAIYCVSPFFVKRITSDNWDVNRNSLGLTYLDYEKAIREVSDLLQAEFVDINNLGFNRFNYYPTFCNDSETYPTHPNALGQKIIGLSLADIVETKLNAYTRWLKGEIV